MGNLAGLLFSLDQFGNRLRRLGALLDPGVDLFLAEFYAARLRPRIIGANLFYITAVARKALVADDNTVKRLFLRPVAAHTNGYAHAFCSLSFIMFLLLLERVRHSAE